MSRGDGPIDPASHAQGIGLGIHGQHVQQLVLEAQQLARAEARRLSVQSLAVGIGHGQGPDRAGQRIAQRVQAVFPGLGVAQVKAPRPRHLDGCSPVPRAGPCERPPAGAGVHQAAVRPRADLGPEREPDHLLVCDHLPIHRQARQGQQRRIQAHQVAQVVDVRPQRIVGARRHLRLEREADDLVDARRDVLQGAPDVAVAGRVVRLDVDLLANLGQRGVAHAPLSFLAGGVPASAFAGVPSAPGVTGGSSGAGVLPVSVGAAVMVASHSRAFS